MVVFGMTRNDNSVFLMFSHYTCNILTIISHRNHDIDHLPDDEKKSAKAEEEDEGNYGSDQHQCAQFLCLFYHLMRTISIKIRPMLMRTMLIKRAISNEEADKQS